MRIVWVGRQSGVVPARMPTLAARRNQAKAFRSRHASVDRGSDPVDRACMYANATLLLLLGAATASVCLVA